MKEEKASSTTSKKSRTQVSVSPRLEALPATRKWPATRSLERIKRGTFTSLFERGSI